MPEETSFSEDMFLVKPHMQLTFPSDFALCPGMRKVATFGWLRTTPLMISTAGQPQKFTIRIAGTEEAQLNIWSVTGKGSSHAYAYYMANALRTAEKWAPVVVVEASVKRDGGEL